MLRLSQSIKINPLLNNIKTRWYSISAKSLQIDLAKRDSDYEGLYFYPDTESNKVYLSFAPPDTIKNKTKLKDAFYIGTTTQQFKDLSSKTIDPKLFIENDHFIQFLHQTLATSAVSVDLQLKALAEYQKEGWLHIPDNRNPAPWGRIPLPEDILGSLLVSGGKIQSNSYQPMPSHRIVSSHGLFLLSESLFADLVEKLKIKLSE